MERLVCLFCFVTILCFLSTTLSPAQTVIDVNTAERSTPIVSPFAFEGNAYFADDAPHSIPRRLLPISNEFTGIFSPRTKIFKFDPESCKVTLLIDLGVSSVMNYSTQAASVNANLEDPSYAFRPVEVGGHFYFLALNHENENTEVWRSDGTTENTVLVYEDTRPYTEDIFIGGPSVEKNQAALELVDDKLVLIRNGLPLFLLTPSASTSRLSDGVDVQGNHLVLGYFSLINSYAAIHNEAIYFIGVEAANAIHMTVYQYSIGTGGRADEIPGFSTRTDETSFILGMDILADGTSIAVTGDRSYSPGEVTDRILYLIDAGTGDVQEVEIENAFASNDAYGVQNTIRSVGDTFVTVISEAVDEQGNVQEALVFVKGPRQVEKIPAPSTGSGGRVSPSHYLLSYANYKDRLYFTLYDEKGDALYRTDGTKAGTQEVHRFNENSAFRGLVQGLFELDGSLYMFARTKAPADPTGGGTGVDTDNFQQSIIRTDGVPGSVYDVIPYAASSDGIVQNLAGVASFTAFKDRLLFTGRSGSDSELWISDGTAAGTEILEDIYSLNGDSSFPYFTKNSVVGDKLFFAARAQEITPQRNFDFGRELLVIDATGKVGADLSGGDVVLVKNIWNASSSSPNGGSSSPNGVVGLNNNAIFAASTAEGLSGRELWMSDGTKDNATLIFDIFPGSTPDGLLFSSFPSFLTELAGKVYFSATGPDDGRELWSTDGTAGGTSQVVDIVTGLNREGTPEGSFPRNLFVFNGKLYFSVFDASAVDAQSRRIYQYNPTDRTSAIFLEREDDDDESVEDNFYTFVIQAEYKGMMLFSFYDEDAGYELWISDGTKTGTKILKDINPLNQLPDKGHGLGVYPATLEMNLHLAPVVYNDKLFFAADDGEKGIELWKVDIAYGDPAVIETKDVVQCKEIYPGPRGSFPRNLTVHNPTGNVGDDRLYFVADHPAYGTELMSIKENSPDIQLTLADSGGSARIYDFEEVPVGVKRNLTLIIRNTGTADLAITSISFSNTLDNLYEHTAAPPFTIAEDDSYSFVVSFMPTAVSDTEVVNTLSVEGTDVDTQKILLRGEGITPLRVSVDGVRVPSGHTESFGVFTSSAIVPSRHLVLEASGEISITNIEVSPSSAITLVSDGLVTPPTGGSSATLLPNGDTISYSVSFDPSMASTTSLDKVTLTVSSMGIKDYYVVNFNGSVGDYYVTEKGEDTRLGNNIVGDFGKVFLGASKSFTYTVYNDSYLPVTLFLLDFEGDHGYSIFPSDRVINIPGKFRDVTSSEEIEVIFSPEEALSTPREASFTLGGKNDATADTTFSFTAETVFAEIEVREDGEAILFRASSTHSARVDGDEYAITFNLTNTGNTDLVITKLDMSGTGFSLTEPSMLPSEGAPLVVAVEETTSITINHSGFSSIRVRGGQLAIESNSLNNSIFQINFSLTFSGSGRNYGSSSLAGIQVYPNPTADYVHVSVPEGGEYGISIYGMNGDLLDARHFIGSSVRISLEDYSVGVYVLEVAGLPSGNERMLLFVE